MRNLCLNENQHCCKLNHPRLFWVTFMVKKNKEKKDLVEIELCFVVGNYRDVMFFRSALWNLGPEVSPSNFLFLGDFVDR